MSCPPHMLKGFWSMHLKYFSLFEWLKSPASNPSWPASVDPLKVWKTFADNILLDQHDSSDHTQPRLIAATYYRILVISVQC